MKLFMKYVKGVRWPHNESIILAKISLLKNPKISLLKKLQPYLYMHFNGVFWPRSKFPNMSSFPEA